MFCADMASERRRRAGAAGGWCPCERRRFLLLCRPAGAGVAALWGPGSNSGGAVSSGCSAALHRAAPAASEIPWDGGCGSLQRPTPNCAAWRRVHADVLRVQPATLRAKFITPAAAIAIICKDRNDCTVHGCYPGALRAGGRVRTPLVIVRCLQGLPLWPHNRACCADCHRPWSPGAGSGPVPATPSGPASGLCGSGW